MVMALRILMAVATASAFSPSGMNAKHSALSYSSSGDYLSSLAGTTLPPPTSRQQDVIPPPETAQQYTPYHPPTESAPNGSFLPPPAQESGGTESFSYASRSFFDIEYLTPKGPRANADVGEPHDATRKLVDLGSTSAGSWWCAEGGWPSLTQRATTEVFYVLSGHGCLTDMDGTRHYFGPGDTVILPKGWAGRWDVQEAIHKVWCVHDHPRIEERASIIRAMVVPHHQLASAEVLVRSRLIILNHVLSFKVSSTNTAFAPMPSTGLRAQPLKLSTTWAPPWSGAGRAVRDPFRSMG